MYYFYLINNKMTNLKQDIFNNIHTKFIDYIDIINKKQYFDLWKHNDNVIDIATSYVLTMNINGIIMKIIVIDDIDNDYEKYKLLLKNIAFNVLNVIYVSNYTIVVNHLNDYLVVKFKKILNDHYDDIYISFYIYNLKEENFYYDIYYDFNFLKDKGYDSSYYDISDDINYLSYIL